MSQTELPNVSILMPTYDRRNFLPLIMTNLYSIDYPKDKLEVVIIDDHKSPLFINDTEVKMVMERVGININYIRDTSRHLSIGEKRNRLVKFAKHKICINMDDDDIYFPSYIRYSVDLLQSNKYGLVGSAQMLFLYPHHNWKIAGIQCESKRQIHEATMCFTKKYWRSMGGFSKNGNGEGAKMVDFNDNKCGYSECGNCMMCVCHSNNTVDKEMFADKNVGGDGSISDEIKIVVAACLEIDYEPEPERHPVFEDSSSDSKIDDDEYIHI